MYSCRQALCAHKKICKGGKDVPQDQNYMNKEVSGHQPKKPVVSKKVSDFINYQQRHNSIQTTNNSTSKEDIGKEADISTKEWSNGTIEFRYNQTCAAPPDS